MPIFTPAIGADLIVSDAKGVYNSPSAQGWATILDNRTAGYWQGLGAGIGRIAQARKAKQKMLDDQLDNLKAEDVGRFYQEEYEKRLGNLFQEVDAGNLSQLGLQKEIAKLKLFRDRSVVVEEDYQDGLDWSETNGLPINQAEYQKWWAGKFVNVAKAGEDPLLRAQNPFDRKSFLFEDGGSKIIDAGYAVKKVLNEVYDNETVIQSWDQGTWQRIADGNLQNVSTTKSTKLPIYTKVVGENQLEIRSADELVDMGILQGFKDNPYTSRVLIDRTKEAIAEKTNLKVSDIQDEDLTDNQMAIVLRDMLESQAYGEIKKSGSLWTLRPVTGSVGDEIQFEMGLDLWTRHIRGGTKEQRQQAIEYLGGGKLGGDYTIAFKDWGETPFTTDPDQVAQAAFGDDKSYASLSKSQKIAVDQFIEDSRYSGGVSLAGGKLKQAPTDSSLLVLTVRSGATDIAGKMMGELGTDIIIIDTVRSSKSKLAYFYRAGYREREKTNYHRMYEDPDKQTPRVPPAGTYYDPFEGMIKSSTYDPDWMGSAKKTFGL